MSDDLVERVARALCEADGCDPDKEIIANQAAGFENFGPLWQANERSGNQLGGRNYVADARAIIPIIQADEREECAKVAENWDRDLDYVDELATAIRERNGSD